ncbi:MAG TPA: GGDEF domain-containing protein [Acidimicrobiales bacterium]|nr:GGDEF domain-containing protein [Acidimicrobiales bacterium]
MATSSGHDDLTGLLDRSGFTGAFAGLGETTAVAVATVDMDGFKGVNDRHGRAVGDELLQKHARTLSGSLPPDALVARVGGDEFVVALPHTSAEGALILLEEVRAYLSAHVAVPALGRPVPITVGVAARPPHGQSLDELLRAADAAMYRAKSEGRNRVALYVDEKMVMKSNYYERGSLAKLAKLSENLGRTEASLLREALDSLITTHARDL